jgi:hypothetical protein
LSGRKFLTRTIPSLRADAFRGLKQAVRLETDALAGGSIDCFDRAGLSLKLKLKIIFKMVGAR